MVDTRGRSPGEEAYQELLHGSHLSTGEDLADVMRRAGKPLGVEVRGLYLVDYRQDVLLPLGGDADGVEGALRIDDTAAGQAFQKVSQVREGIRLWVPIIDGTERIGVIEVVSSGADLYDTHLTDTLGWLANCLGHIVGAKRIFGRALEVTRRTEPLSLAAELLLRLLPPLTAAVEGLVISGVVEPCYDVGGDCFDYGLDGGIARFCVLDAMGHSLPAGLLTAVGLAAYRRGRNADASLEETVTGIDTALREHALGDRFVTAALGELDIGSGSLRYVVAGHPLPLVVRGGRVVRQLEGSRGTPLGLRAGVGSLPEVAEEQLEPGDRLLLYTDGVTEARDTAGELFGVSRLIEVVEREARSPDSAPETLRRIGHAVLGHQHGKLQDDATLLLVEWSTGKEREMDPQVVEE
jgi:sigma-B regulation protein RsbU (phosphoserine phosphatase)